MDIDSTVFHRERLRAKALDSLNGLCTGLVADKRLTNVELLFLDVWLKDNQDLHNDPDVFDLIDLIEDLLKKERVSRAELNDLQQLIEDILQYGVYECSDPIGMNHLLSVIQGVMADGKLNDKEIKSLNRYMKKSPASSVWPASELFSRLQQVLADGVIDEDERHELTIMLQALSGDFTSTGSAGPRVISLGLDIDVNVIFPEKVFCFTGIFAFGKRSKCVSAIESRGGVFSKSMTRKTDYLVLGSMVARDWMYMNYGLKLEKALDYRQRHSQDVKIISEKDWLSAILS